jgi:hypothetical protein
MTTENYTTSNSPHLTLTCHSDLSIAGTGDNAVSIAIDDDSPATKIDRSGETITVTAMDACDIVCPPNTSITIELASGDLRVTGIKGTLAINTVNGDAALRDIGPAMIKTVQGDLSIRDVTGDLRVETARGDAKVKRIDGQITIDHVAGDLVAHDLGRGAAFAHVTGDLAIETELEPGQSYSGQANGDIVLRVNGGGAQLTLSAKGDLRTRVPLTNWQGDDRSGSGTLGDGSASVALNANGDVLILPGQGRWDTGAFAGQVESMIESAMSQFESQMSRVQHEMEERWGSQAERAAERARRSAERAKKRAERAAGSWGAYFTLGKVPTPPMPPEPVTDQERMMVLKMVEGGKLTADQAAQLLAAMEG